MRDRGKAERKEEDKKDKIYGMEERGTVTHQKTATTRFDRSSAAGNVAMEPPVGAERTAVERAISIKEGGEWGCGGKSDGDSGCGKDRQQHQR